MNSGFNKTKRPTLRSLLLIYAILRKKSGIPQIINRAGNNSMKNFLVTFENETEVFTCKWGWVFLRSEAWTQLTADSTVSFTECRTLTVTCLMRVARAPSCHSRSGGYLGGGHSRAHRTPRPWALEGVVSRHTSELEETAAGPGGRAVGVGAVGF